MAEDQVNPVEAFDMHIAHIGINAADAAEAERTAALIEALFGLERHDTPISVFNETLIEVMKGCGRGEKGHIGLAVNDVPAAEAYFRSRGLTINEDSRALNPDGSTKLVYFNEDIAGFAVHLSCS
ncbi:VOC family protein [uncultured Enorma sp.]|uniref:VOC family protein n=1 Tax=uncultured Enorma sp. TaxID=1714346 RepID=UPI0025966991|nr:VOC family protein [uncultured Enorma sp.]